MSVEKEALALLRDTYLFFTISDSLENLSDELLIQVYLRLLHVLDPNYDLQGSTSTGVPLPADALKHIHKSLRHLELLHLVGKASHLLDKKIFVRLCSALHDKITARYGSKSSTRIRKIMKAEELSRRKKKRVEKDEFRGADDESTGKGNELPAEAAETLPGVGIGRKAAGVTAKRRQFTHVIKKDLTMASSEEQTTETNVVVVPHKGRELARTPVRPQTSSASTDDSNTCSSPNTSASSLVHGEPTDFCQPAPESPCPVGHNMPPPPLDLDIDSVKTGETASSTDLPFTPTLEILAVNCKRTDNTGAVAGDTAAVNIIPSGRQIARTPVGGKLSGDAQDAFDLENATSPSEESDLVPVENISDINKSALQPCSPVESNSILLDINSKSAREMSKDLSDFILKPPPGFDSPLGAGRSVFSSSSDESDARSPHALKTEKIVENNDGTYIINNATYCASTDQLPADSAVFCDTPERLPVFASKNTKTYVKTNVDLSCVNGESAKQPSAADGTFVLHSKNFENKTYVVDAECEGLVDEVEDTNSFKFDSSFDDSDSIFPSKQPAKKNDVKRQLHEKQLKVNAESEIKNLHSNKNIEKSVTSLENDDKIEQLVERRVRQSTAKAKGTKAASKGNFPSPKIKTKVKALAITTKIGKRKPRAFSSDKDTAPVLKKAVQSAASPSPAMARPKRQRNTRTVNYCEISIIGAPTHGGESASADDRDKSDETDGSEVLNTCVGFNKDVKMIVPNIEVATVKQRIRKQAVDVPHQRTRATRPKTEPLSTVANENDSNGNKTVKVSRRKLKSENACNVPDEAIKSVVSVVSPEPAKSGGRRRKFHQNDLQGIAEESASVRRKLQVTRAQETESKTASETTSSHSSEFGEQNADGFEEPDVLSRTESSVQKNRGRNTRPPVSNIVTSVDKNEVSSPIGGKGSRKTGLSIKHEKTGRIARKKVTANKDALQHDCESASTNPSPPKRIRFAKSSASNDLGPDVDTTHNVTKPKIGKARRADSPVVQNLPSRRNLKPKNESEMPAAASTQRGLPALGSKRKAKDNVASSDASGPVARGRSRR